MTYTILSAAYATEDKSAAIIMTEEAGAVVVSEADTPDLWEELQAWGTPDAYKPPQPPPVDLKDEFSKATTTTAKIAVLAKALNLV